MSQSSDDIPVTNERERALREAGDHDGHLRELLTAARERRDEPAAPELASLFEALDAQRKREATHPVGRLRALSTPARRAVLLAATALAVGAAAALVPRPDLAVYPVAPMLATLAVMAVVVVGAVRLASWPLQRAEPSPRRLWLWLVLGGVVAPLALAAMPEVHAAHPASLAGAGADFAPRAAGCFAFGAALALPVLALLWMADRGEHRSWWRVALAAVAAGMAGDLALQLHCPITFPGHLLAGHATVVLAVVAGYAALQRLWRRA